MFSKLPRYYFYINSILTLPSTFRYETEELKKKLENLEKKILVGGENLLEKVETQEQLLEMAAKELEERKAREDHLTEQIKQKEVFSSHFRFIYLIFLY